MASTSRLLAATVTFALLGVPAVSGSSSAADRVAAERASLSASAKSPELILGQGTRIFGAIKPGTRGVTVALQRKFASGWGVLAARKTNGQGKYSFKVEPTAPGIASYRTVRLNRLGEVNLRSKKVRVTTYQWHHVTELNITDNAGVTDFDVPASIGGASHPRSILLDSDAIAEEPTEAGFFVVDTQRRCAAFATVLGALDDNTPGTVVRGTVTGDDDVLSDQTYEVGAFDALILNIRGVSRVRVDTVAVEQDVTRGLGVGTPMMLCAFESLIQN